MRKLSILAVVIALAVAASVWLLSLALNARDGCYPWSPKTVPFHQGMTICPGQSAVMTVTVP